MSQKLEHQTSVIESLEFELNQLKDERQIERQRQQEEVIQIIWYWNFLLLEVLTIKHGGSRIFMSNSECGSKITTDKEWVQEINF